MKTLISTSENVDFYIYMYIYVCYTELSCKLKSDNFYTQKYDSAPSINMQQ